MPSAKAVLKPPQSRRFANAKRSPQREASGLRRVYRRFQAARPAYICGYFASVFSTPIFFRNGSIERGRPRNFSIETFTSRASPTA